MHFSPSFKEPALPDGQSAAHQLNRFILYRRRPVLKVGCIVRLPSPYYILITIPKKQQISCTK